MQMIDNFVGIDFRINNLLEAYGIKSYTLSDSLPILYH